MGSPASRGSERRGSLNPKPPPPPLVVGATEGRPTSYSDANPGALVEPGEARLRRSGSLNPLTRTARAGSVALNVPGDGGPQEAPWVENGVSLGTPVGEEVPWGSGEPVNGRAWPERGGDPEEHASQTEGQGRTRKKGPKEVRRAQRAAKKAVLEVL